MRPSISFPFSPNPTSEPAPDTAASNVAGLPRGGAGRAWMEDRGVADPRDWPPEQVWLHPDRAAFADHHATVEECLLAHLSTFPPRLQAGPLGCATPRNVKDFRSEGRPDLAWRLAARLCLRAQALGLPGYDGQTASDLALSAALLAGELHGCALGAVEAVALIDRLAEHAGANALDYPGLGLTGVPLEVRLRYRRRSVVERLAQRMPVDGGSPESVEALMWRAPVLAPAPSGSPRP